MGVMGEQGVLGHGERMKEDTYSVEEVGELPLKTKTKDVSHTSLTQLLLLWSAYNSRISFEHSQAAVLPVCGSLCFLNSGDCC